MNIRDLNRFSEYQPSSKSVQDLLDHFHEALKPLLKQPAWCIQGLRYKVKQHRGLHFVIHALVDREQEFEIHIHKESSQYRSRATVVSVKPLLKEYSL